MTQVQASQPRKLMKAHVQRFQPVMAEIKMRKVGQTMQNADRLGIEAYLVMRQPKRLKSR
ncbi:hypothetical protein D3C80_575350 [compost metagenome]